MLRVLCVLGTYFVASWIPVTICIVWLSSHPVPSAAEPYAGVACLLAISSGPFIWLAQACGFPCFWVPVGPICLLVTCVSSQLRNLPLVVHFAIGFIWVSTGLLWVMLCY